MDQHKSLFRKKSLKNISSPEQLNDYLKVARPGVWVILIGIIIFLVGVCAWGFLGKLESVIKAPVVISDNARYLFISDMNIRDVKAGTEVIFGDTKAQVVDISSQPIQASEIGDDYFLFTGGFSSSEWIYICTLDGGVGGMAEGVYEARVILGSMSPMSFVTN